MALVQPAPYLISRRALLARSMLATGGLLVVGAAGRALAQGGSAAIITSDRMRPKLDYGVQTGDLMGERAILWARSDRPARLVVDWATTESMTGARTIEGPFALEDSDFTAKLDLEHLPLGQKVFYRVRLVDLADRSLESEPVTGSLMTPPAGRSDIRFVWSGDTAGQGWGINPDFGGMRIYEVMRAVEPAFFIHSGDTIYADGPIPAEKELPGGGVWKNLTTEAKSKVAETLAEFRGNYTYNLMDENLRRFNAQVPMFAQWDDHETTNNWYPQEDLSQDPRKTDYKVTSAALLGARAARAFQEYMPVRWGGSAHPNLYRSFGYGPALDIFRIDMRSFRGPNTANRQAQQGPETVFLGAPQVRWLKQALLASDATWKVIASDMPIGLIVRDGDDAFENLANGNGQALGRELEMANLLRFIRDNEIRNVVWLTADVHYTAAHHYHPNRARFQEFAPFWEFVSGPLNAGTFGPGELDDTFGPEVRFAKAPPAGQENLPPSAGLQFFGQVDIAGADEVMTVRLKDIAGRTLFTQELLPEI
jgi:alkaline phosphatase D